MNIARKFVKFVCIVKACKVFEYSLNKSSLIHFFKLINFFNQAWTSYRWTLEVQQDNRVLNRQKRNKEQNMLEQLLQLLPSASC